jgi:hypothetical protein
VLDMAGKDGLNVQTVRHARSEVNLLSVADHVRSLDASVFLPWPVVYVRGVSSSTLPRYFTVRYGNGMVRYGKIISSHGKEKYLILPFFAVLADLLIKTSFFVVEMHLFFRQNVQPALLIYL